LTYDTVSYEENVQEGRLNIDKNVKKNLANNFTAVTNNKVITILLTILLFLFLLTTTTTITLYKMITCI